MQTASFGRKGLPDSEMERRKAAFIAAERERAAGTGNPLASAPAERPRDRFDAAEDYLRRKSLIVTYALWFVAGQFGAHRLFLGAYRSGASMAATWLAFILILLAGASSKSAAMLVVGMIMMVGLAFWILADLFLIPGLRAKLALAAGRRDFGSVFA